jgi:menaquinone-dependent protoporphyrinogen oxidase
MRVLVTYGTKHGATGGIAEWIAEALRADGLVAEVHPAEPPTAVERYDAVIVGGALYMMRWHRAARRFVRHHREALAARPVWLFSTGPLDRSAEDRDIPPVRSVARAAAKVGARGHKTFGGYISMDTPGRMAHSIAEKSAGDYRNREQVEEWAHSIAAALRQPVSKRENDRCGSPDRRSLRRHRLPLSSPSVRP